MIYKKDGDLLVTQVGPDLCKSCCPCWFCDEQPEEVTVTFSDFVDCDCYYDPILNCYWKAWGIAATLNGQQFVVPKHHTCSWRLQVDGGSPTAFGFLRKYYDYDSDCNNYYYLTNYEYNRMFIHITRYETYVEIKVHLVDTTQAPGYQTGGIIVMGTTQVFDDCVACSVTADSTCEPVEPLPALERDACHSGTALIEEGDTT